MKKLLIICFLFPLILCSQEIITEEFQLKNGDIDLPGTLRYQNSNNKLPLVIFIHGSGNVDRNGNQAGVSINANYIRTLADSLTAKGIAFYSYDKRTVQAENIAKEKNIGINHFADDALVAINHFKDDQRFNGIHLIGHSQGSLVGMLCITTAVKSYISLAGAGQTIDETLVSQVTQQSPELGIKTKEHFDELIKTDTILSVNPMLISIFHPQNQKFFKSWALIDPISEIKKINIPILILNGDTDLQVSVTDAQRLKEAASHAELHIIKNMNHVLKEVKSLQENRLSYTQPQFPLSNELVLLIHQFISKQ